jgi:uncharacterized protein (DUF362 family)
MVREALRLVGAAQAVSVHGRVVIKPNYVEPRRPSTGVTTDPRIIEAVVEWIQELGVNDITIAEGGDTAAKTDLAFRMVGLPEIAERRGVRLLNVFHDERVEVDIPGGSSLPRVGLSRTVLEADCLIDLPKLKCHCMAGVTLGIKNLMGAVIPDKMMMHRDLHERLADLALVLRPRLCLIDGLIGSAEHETAGRPVKSDLIIAGRDVVATDAIGCLAMGIDPMQIRHLRLCAERGLGEVNPRRIRALGAPIEKVRKDYQ